MRWEYAGTGLTLIGIGISLVVALPPPWWPKMPTLLTYLGVLLGIFLIILGASILVYGSWDVIPVPKGPIILAVFATLLLVAAGVWFLSSTPSHLSSGKATASKEITIQRLWRADFGDSGSYKMLQWFGTDLFKINGDKLGHYDFGVGIYGDFHAKSVFLSLYAPASNHAFDFISWFADGYRVYLEDARKNIHIWAAPQGDQSQPTSDNLIFTNKIYIYYENILSDDQIGELDRLYRGKGLDPVFRGFGYLEYRRLKVAAGEEKLPVEAEPKPAPSSAPNFPPVEVRAQFPENDRPPSLLSLYMTEFKGVGAVAAGWTDVALSNNTKERVQFRVYADVRKRQQFMACYFAPSNATAAIMRFLASRYVDQMDDLTRRVASDSKIPKIAAVYAKHYPFSGMLYAYVENSPSDEEITEIKRLYLHHGATIEVRDFGYAVKKWNQIKAGKGKMPPEYKLTDTFPQPITNHAK